MTTPDDILHYFYGHASPSSFEQLRDWLLSINASRDDEIRERFGSTIEEAFAGGLQDWESSDDGRLALLIVLDQFPRHAFRGQARQYAGDTWGLALAQALVSDGAPERLPPECAMSILMALGHCEVLEVHERNITLADAHAARCPAFWGPVAGIGPSQSRKYCDIIRRFARFPHRNEMLGRPNTPDEEEWLRSGGPATMPPDVIRDGSLLSATR